MLELIPFCFNEAIVHTVVREDAPWFVARDVCNALELEHITYALSNHDKDELTISAEDVVWALLLVVDALEEVQKRVSTFQNHVSDVWDQQGGA